MRIPSDPVKKDAFLQEVIQACEVSQMDRLNSNQALRNYALFGQSESTAYNLASYNKIWPTLQLLSSFLYAQETVNFSVSFGTGTPKEQATYGETVRKKTHELWKDTGASKKFGDAVDWSLVYASAFAKLIYNGGIRPYYVEPHMIGVYREDIPDMDNQEAVLHLYYSTTSGLRSILRSFKSDESVDEVMKKVSTVGTVDESVAPRTVTQMILNSQIPNARGAINPIWESRYQYLPQTIPDLVECKEVWVFDDDLEDYRVFNVASPNVVIMQREGKDLCCKGEHPFIKVTPFPLPNYFWGMSLVQGLIGLQD